MTKNPNHIDTPDLDIPDLGDVLKQLKLAFVAGLIIIVVFAFQSSSWSQFISVVGVGFIIALAVFFFGILIGFIFGIPRILSEPRLPAPNVTNGLTTQQESFQIGPYGENTNFDQVSDWLTKILIGIGLVQLVRVPAALQQYSNNIAPALGNFPNNASGSFGIAILIFFSVNGFFVGYLWTRRRAALEFGLGRSELNQITGKLKEKLKDVQDKVSEIDERTRNDLEAVKVVNRVLNTLPGSPPVSQEELREKIQKASGDAISMIFYSASGAREKNMLENKPIMERTIPIFRALIANDIEEKYENNHAELGLALMNKQPPEWTEAENEFTKSIKIRDSWEPKSGLEGLKYEFYRAICRIHSCDGFDKGNKTAAENSEKILKDIISANNNPDLSRLMISEKETPISKWMGLNELNIQDYIHSK